MHYTRHIVRGSAWAFFLRWSIRLLGFITTLILARLLTPNDFGVVSMAMIVVGAIEMLAASGQKFALIRHPNPTSSHFDTAWTLSILMGAAVTGAILIVAPVTADLLGEPRVLPVAQCLAFGALIRGFENVGLVKYQRDLKFDRDFSFALQQKVAAFVLTVCAALLLRSYWAIVFGILISRLLAVALSYRMHPFRPHLSLAEARDLWSYSGWTLLADIGLYLTSRTPHLSAAQVGGTAGIGHYEVGSELGAAPAAEITTPLLSALFPVMASVRDNMPNFMNLLFRIQQWSAFLLAPIAIGMALVSDDFVPVILGDQWTPVIAILVWVSIAAGIDGLMAPNYVALGVLGRTRLIARLQWTRAAFVALCLAPGLSIANLEALAFGRMMASFIFIPVLFLSVSSVLPGTTRQMLFALRRPLIGVAILSTIISLMDYLWTLPNGAALFRDVVVGALVYPVSCISLWWASDRGESPEATIIDRFRAGCSRLGSLHARVHATGDDSK